METWQDQAIILNIRSHGENGAVVSVLSEHHGRQAGYVHGARSSKMRGTLEIGNLVDARWQAKTDDSLGTLNIELARPTAALIMDDALKLGALKSACALCERALPERESHTGLFNGLNTFFSIMDQDIWDAAYVMWEIALLKELGFSLDLTTCAGGGDPNTLAYVSPKTGRAVSYSAGEPYKEKLLNLPAFLKPNGGPAEIEDILTGLKMTGYFLEHWVFNHHSQGVPEARIILQQRFTFLCSEQPEQRSPQSAQ